MLIKDLEERKNRGNLRKLVQSEAKIDFASNDYLGLARSTELKKAVELEWERISATTHLNGLGSTGSRLLTGNQRYCEELESAIASYHGYEAGLLFNCGYMANLALLSCIPKSGDRILYDTSIHASSRAGIGLSTALATAWRHNDLNSLENKLKRGISLQGKSYVCIESLYSTDGSVAPLTEIQNLCAQYRAELFVDEAHACGVFGTLGKGLCNEAGLNERPFAHVHTFGKALGTQGAIILGTSLLRQYLINFAKPFIYTTALPLYALIAIKCSYKMLPTLEKERGQLRKLIAYFYEKTQGKTGSHTQIQPISIKSNLEGKALAERLAHINIDARPLLYPTVPRDKECLRICLHAFNTINEIDELLQCVKL